jgi:hypothetical protein
MNYRKSTEETYSLAILPLNDELVLQDNDITLAGCVRHQSLQTSAESVKQILSPWLDLLCGREESDPPETRNDASRLRFRWELADSLDFLNKGTMEV